MYSKHTSFDRLSRRKNGYHTGQLEHIQSKNQVTTFEVSNKKKGVNNRGQPK